MAGSINRKGTLKGLAAELDLSVTTVSRALGGYSDVAEGTRQRVLAAASRADYVPNSAAQMLVTGRTGFVGLLLPLQNPAILDPFLGEYITGLSQGLAERGRDLFMATVPSSQSELTVLQHVVESGRADAMVLTRISEQDDRVDYLTRRGFPFVTHGRTLDSNASYRWVDTDGRQAFFDTFKWLYSMGHRRFGLLSIEESMTFRAHREQGLVEGIAEQNDPEVTLLTRRVPRFDVDARISAIRQLLLLPDRPTAVLTLTDELGLGVIEQAALLGIAIPEQLSVVGFDNIPAAAYTSPGLTTFDQSIRQTARQIAAMVLDSLEGVESDQQTLISPPLIKRGSHAPAPAIPSSASKADHHHTYH